MAYLNNYVNSVEISTFIEIQLRIAKKRLNQLRYIYRNIKTDIFINRHLRIKMIKD